MNIANPVLYLKYKYSCLFPLDYELNRDKDLSPTTPPLFPSTPIILASYLAPNHLWHFVVQEFEHYLFFLPNIPMGHYLTSFWDFPNLITLVTTAMTTQFKVKTSPRRPKHLTLSTSMMWYNLLIQFIDHLLPHNVSMKEGHLFVLFSIASLETICIVLYYIPSTWNKVHKSTQMINRGGNKWIKLPFRVYSIQHMIGIQWLLIELMIN